MQVNAAFTVDASHQMDRIVAPRSRIMNRLFVRVAALSVVLCPVNSIAVAAASAPPVRGALGASAAPNIEGIWQPVFVPPLVDVAVGSGVLRTTEGSLPPFKPDAAKTFRRRLELEKKGTPLANVDNTCRPHHMVIDLVLWLAPFEIVQTDSQVTFLFEASNSHLTVHLDRDHPKNVKPTYRGDVVGHWDGDVLVVDTVGFNGKSWLDPSGTPASDHMHWITRIQTAADGKSLSFLTTIDDPATFDSPWTTLQTAERKTGTRILETDCLENARPESNQQIIYEDWKPPFWDPRAQSTPTGISKP